MDLEFLRALGGSIKVNREALAAAVEGETKGNKKRCRRKR